MHNWDDYRFFLTVANLGSVTAAAVKLKVNQSTVSRRINAFELHINVRLFDRLSTGYVLTIEGEELKKHVIRMEEETLAIHREVIDKNITLSGSIRVTTSVVMSQYGLMPLFEKFLRKFPDIELQLDLSNNLYNLNQREADVAIRVSHDSLPENIIARELGSIGFAVYGEKSYLESISRTNAILSWIGEDNNDSRPNWIPKNINPIKLVMRTNDALATKDAIKNKLGIGRLPTIIGDNEKILKRLEYPASTKEAPVYLLTHTDMRRVNRVKVFNDFIVDEMRKKLHHLAEPLR